MLNFICFEPKIHFSDSIKIFIRLINFNCIWIKIFYIPKFMKMILFRWIPLINMFINISSKSITCITEKSLFKFNRWQPDFTLSYRLMSIYMKINFVIDYFEPRLFLINIFIYFIFCCTWWIHQFTFFLIRITILINLCLIS